MAAAAGSVSAHLSSDPSSQQRWICIYPAYINSKKSTKEGRRIAKEKGVENPTVQEIRDVCASQGLSVMIENDKRYPRELALDAHHIGRVRVQLKNADGSPCKAQFKTRKEILLFLGEMIPRLKTRQSRGATGGAEAAASSQSTGSKSKSKKKKK